MNKRLERIDTAIKAIWRMYRWGRWKWLEAVGVRRSVYEEKFQMFELSVFGEGLSYEQVIRLLQLCGPDLVDRAIFLVHMYWLIGELK